MRISQIKDEIMLWQYVLDIFQKQLNFKKK